MKRITTILLSLLLCFSLAACGSSSKSSNDVADSVAEEEVNSEPVESGDTTETEEGAETSSETEDFSFEELTIVDDDNMTVRLESYDPDSVFGPSFSVYLENKTEDVTLMFSVLDAAVNGVMCDPFWSSEVAPGMKSYSDLSFYNLENAGVNYIETIEMIFHVYNSDDWTEDDYFRETVTVNIENDTEETATFRRTSENGFSDIVLEDNDSVCVTVIDYDPENISGPSFTLYIENRSDKNIMVSADDVSVNGFMCDPYWATDVWSGKNAYSTMSWLSSSLEESKIDSIEDVSFTLRVYDDDNWMDDDMVHETVTFSVP